jgi:hypothetical protein
MHDNMNTRTSTRNPDLNASMVWYDSEMARYGGLHFRVICDDHSGNFCHRVARIDSEFLTRALLRANGKRQTINFFRFTCNAHANKLTMNQETKARYQAHHQQALYTGKIERCQSHEARKREQERTRLVKMNRHVHVSSQLFARRAEAERL